MVELLSYFYSNPALAYTALALVLIIAYRSLAPRLRIRVPGVGFSTEGLIGKLLGPRYQEAQRKIDQKYDHKRGKVERNSGKDHRKYHDKLDRWHDHYHN